MARVAFTGVALLVTLGVALSMEQWAASRRDADGSEHSGGQISASPRHLRRRLMGHDDEAVGGTAVAAAEVTSVDQQAQPGVQHDALAYTDVGAGDSGAGGIEQRQATAVLVFATFFVGFGVAFDKGQEMLFEHTGEHTKPIVQSLFSELATLGCVGVMMFLLQKTANLEGISDTIFDSGDELTELLELVHMVLFLIMVLFLLAVLQMVYVADWLQVQWHEAETACANEDEVITTGACHLAGQLPEVKVSLFDTMGGPAAGAHHTPTFLSSDAARFADEADMEFTGSTYTQSFCPCMARCGSRSRKVQDARRNLVHATLRARFVAETVASTAMVDKATGAPVSHESAARNEFDFGEYLTILMGHTLSEVVELTAPTWLMMELMVVLFWFTYMFLSSAVFEYAMMGFGYVLVLFLGLLNHKMHRVQAELTSGALFHKAAAARFHAAATLVRAATKFLARRRAHHAIRRRRSMRLGSASSADSANDALAAARKVAAEYAAKEEASKKKGAADAGESKAGGYGSFSDRQISMPLRGSGSSGAPSSATDEASAARPASKDGGGGGGKRKVVIAAENELKSPLLNHEHVRFAEDVSHSSDSDDGHDDDPRGTGAASHTAPRTPPRGTLSRVDTGASTASAMSSPSREHVISSMAPNELVPPYMRRQITMRGPIGRKLLGRPSNKHEQLFWFGHHGPHFVLHSIRTVVLLTALFLSANGLIMFRGTCSADAWWVCAIHAVVALVPVTWVFFLMPFVLQAFVVTTNVEMMPERQVMSKVLRIQRTRKAMRALKLITAMKVHATKLTVEADAAEPSTSPTATSAMPSGEMKRRRTYAKIKSASDVYGDRASAKRRRRERELKEVFKLFDRDGDGTVDAENLASMLATLGMAADARDTANAIMAEIDVDGSGEITFDEFVDWMAMQDAGNEELTEDQLYKQIFQIIDRDGSNEINASELQSTLESLGEGMSHDDVLAIVREADTDGNGTIDCNEFVAMLARHTKHNDYGL